MYILKRSKCIDHSKWKQINEELICGGMLFFKALNKTETNGCHILKVSIQLFHVEYNNEWYNSHQ